MALLLDVIAERLAIGSSSVSATNTLPSGPYHAGIWCPHHNWREMHQGSMFPIHANRSAPNSAARISYAPSAAAIAGCASVWASTYHWSVRYGSITTPERSPCGTIWVFGSIFSRKPKSSSRDTTVLRAAKRSAFCSSSRKLQRAFGQVAQIDLVADQSHTAFLVEHADLRKIVALADFKVIEVMRRRDLNRARALLGIGICVGDDRNPAADQRQDHVLADQMAVTIVVGIHRDCAVAEHGLRPRGRDHDEDRGIVGAERLAFDRIAEIPERALDFDLLDFEIADRVSIFGSQLTSRLSL